MSYSDDAVERRRARWRKQQAKYRAANKAAVEQRMREVMRERLLDSFDTWCVGHQSAVARRVQRAYADYQRRVEGDPGPLDTLTDTVITRRR